MTDEVQKWPTVTAVVESTGVGDFQALVRANGATFLVDEPIEAGGLGTGPNPYELLGISLGACTVLTLRLYARMKKIPLRGVRVEVSHLKDDKNAVPDQFLRVIHLDGRLDDQARARLLKIALRCPVYRTLINGARIETELAGE